MPSLITHTTHTHNTHTQHTVAGNWQRAAMPCSSWATTSLARYAMCGGVWACGCMSVRICVCMCIRIHTHTHTQNLCTHITQSMHPSVHITQIPVIHSISIVFFYRFHDIAHTRKYICLISFCFFNLTLALTHTRTHTHTHTFVYIYYTHTHTHTHTHNRIYGRHT
jgi:hypothetical protein